MCPRSAPNGDSDRSTTGQSHGWRASRPVGRVLCTRVSGPTAIHLGLPLPAASCGLPASIGRAALERSRREPLVPLLDLAPGGVYLAAAVTCGAGGLLHRLFTLTPALARGRSVFCGTVPRVTPGRRYRPPCPMEPGPSSPDLTARRDRPADSPGVRIRGFQMAWACSAVQTSTISSVVMGGSGGEAWRRLLLAD